LLEFYRNLIKIIFCENLLKIMSVEALFLSPIREPMVFRHPDIMSYSPPDEFNTRGGQMTPSCLHFGSPPAHSTSGTLTFTSPEYPSIFNSPPYTPDHRCGGDMPSPLGAMKRGRPRANQINSLIVRGNAMVESAIRCQMCSRVFPRDKSLQAHMRTHTGEHRIFKYIHN